MSAWLGGRPCLDASACREAFESLPPSSAVEGDWLRRANSFTCPLGAEPGRGRLLMLRGDLLALDLEDTHDLVFDDGRSRVTLRNLVIVRAAAALPSSRDNQQGAVWVDVADRRHLAARTAIDAAYNLRSQPGEDETGPIWYASTLDDSVNPSVLWSWEDMVNDIWDTVGMLGDYPGLPFAPDGDPEGFNFYGASAYNALNSVLGQLSCALKYDPIEDVFSVVQIGDTDAVADAALSDYDAARLWDDYDIESAIGRIPEKVVVHFRKHLWIPDTDGGSPWHTVEVEDADPLPGVEAGTRALLYDGLPASYDADGVLVNEADIIARADERAADYFRHVRMSRLRRRFTGSIGNAGMLPGAQLKATVWHDLGDGCCTEIAYYPGLIQELYPVDPEEHTSDQPDVVYNWLSSQTYTHGGPVHIANYMHWWTTTVDFTNATENDVALPAGKPLYRFRPNQNCTVTGIVPPDRNADCIIGIINDSSFNLTIPDNSGSSAAENRIVLAGGRDVVLLPNDAIILWYRFGSYWVHISGTCATLNVAETDGSPSVPSVGRLVVNYQDGYQVVDNSDGEAQLNMLSASTGQKGAVDLVTQQFAGVKDFTNAMRSNGSVQIYTDYAAGDHATIQFVNFGGGVSQILIFGGLGGGTNGPELTLEGDPGSSIRTLSVTMGTGNLSLVVNNAGSSYFSNSGFPGIWGTLGFGATVKGGIITAAGGAASGVDIDDGTW